MDIVRNFPNVIVFHHDDTDGICAAFIIKQKYDNSLSDSDWDRNVTCIPCNYGEKYNLQFFKDKVAENESEDLKNIIYMVDYAIQPNDEMIKFWNWCNAMGYELVWIDHHITAIENIGHYDISGLRNIKEAGCMNVWNYMHQTEISPMILRYVNDFDIWNKNSIYSWEKTLFPLVYFLESLGSDLNNNEGELVKTLNACFADNKNTDNIIKIGQYIAKFINNQYNRSLRRIKEVEWNGYKCLILNSSFRGSEQFSQYKSEDGTPADLMIVWSYDGKKYTFSIYTEKKNIDVGQICQSMFNGGGHKGAGGGCSSKFPFYEI